MKTTQITAAITRKRVLFKRFSTFTMTTLCPAG